MKLINAETIKNLNPCQDRFDNYLKYYELKEFTPNQFLGLKNITQHDKLWVAFRLMPKSNIRFAAADIAESVLYIYENAYPNDPRPRKAIEAARSGDKSAAATTSVDAYTASYAAISNASSAASNAAHAVASAAIATSYAADAACSAAYDVSTTATTAAAHAAAFAADAAAFAAYVADSAAYAAYVASNTTSCSEADSAAYAAYVAANTATYASTVASNAASAGTSKQVQEKLIRKIVLKYWKNNE